MISGISSSSHGGRPGTNARRARWSSGTPSALARFAVASGERNEVDELVQDTFVRAFNSLDGFRGDSSFRTWLFTIERRLLLDRRRAEKRRRDRVEIQEDDAATEYDALDSVVADETERRMQRRGEAAVADAEARSSRFEWLKGCRTRRSPRRWERRKAPRGCITTTRCAR